VFVRGLAADLARVDECLIVAWEEDLDTSRQESMDGLVKIGGVHSAKAGRTPALQSAMASAWRIQRRPGLRQPNPSAGSSCCLSAAGETGEVPASVVRVDHELWEHPGEVGVG
jgi:hypothetical protein